MSQMLPEDFETNWEVGPWKCYHCGEVCHTKADATFHFGTDQCETPACLDRLTAEEFHRRQRDILGRIVLERELRRGDEAEAKAVAVSFERHDLWKFGREVTTVGEAFRKYEFEIDKNEAALHFIAAIERLAPAAVAAARDELKLYPDAYTISASGSRRP